MITIKSFVSQKEFSVLLSAVKARKKSVVAAEEKEASQSLPFLTRKESGGKSAELKEKLDFDNNNIDSFNKNMSNVHFSANPNSSQLDIFVDNQYVSELDSR